MMESVQAMCVIALYTLAVVCGTLSITILHYNREASKLQKPRKLLGCALSGIAAAAALTISAIYIARM